MTASPQMRAEPGSSWSVLAIPAQSTNNTLFPPALRGVFLCPGKACVLKCLLDVHKVFRGNEPAYILNDLYVTDYCVWIQRLK